METKVDINKIADCYAEMIGKAYDKGSRYDPAAYVQDLLEKQVDSTHIAILLEEYQRMMPWPISPFKRN